MNIDADSYHQAPSYALILKAEVGPFNPFVFSNIKYPL